MSENVTTVQKVLKQLQYHDSFRVMDDDVILESDFDIDFNQWVLRLKTRVLAEELADDVYYGHMPVETPETTWQMFKATNQNTWWLRRFVERFPVRYHRDILEVPVRVQRYVKYPDAEVSLPKLGRPVPVEYVTVNGERQ